MNTENTIDLNKVLRFAERKHKGQLRNGGCLYIEHPKRVADIIKNVKANSKNLNFLIAAALLHDTIEDTETSYIELERNFGKLIASIVIELSSAPFAAEMKGKAQYLCGHMLNMTPYALTIKLADRLDNLNDMKHYQTDKVIRNLDETKIIIDFLLKNRELNQSQKILIDELKATIKQKEESLIV